MPYTSRKFHHSFAFINTEVTDLTSINNSIEEKQLHIPSLNDENWSGCFCFLDEYDTGLLQPYGALSSWAGKKLNIGEFSKTEVIWVRNISHLGKEYPFYNKFKYPLLHEGQIHWFSNQSMWDCYKWVKMNVDRALYRTELWKKANPGKPLPEWLTEFYMLKDQKEKLKVLGRVKKKAFLLRKEFIRFRKKIII